MQYPNDKKQLLGTQDNLSLKEKAAILMVSLGEEALNYSEDSMDSQKLEALHKECCFIIKELEREKFYPIPKKFIFTPPFTEESGFLTPTKKTKPQTVITHYEKLLNQLQSEDGFTLYFLDKENKLKGFGP